MVNYSNGKIYKLVNNVDEKIYVGSTCGSLRLRKSGHKIDSKRKPSPVQRHLNEIGWETVEIILIEAFECNNKDELHKRERYWIDELKPELNKQLPTQTRKEYRDKNKEYFENYRGDNKNKLKEYHINYRNENKESINQKKKEKINCDCGGKYTRTSKSRHMKTKKHINFINPHQ